MSGENKCLRFPGLDVQNQHLMSFMNDNTHVLVSDVESALGDFRGPRCASAARGQLPQ